MTSWNPDPKRGSTGTAASRFHPALRFVRRHARRLAIASSVTLVLTPLLALNAANAASATPIALAAPPDATHTTPYTYQGQVYYINQDTLTATGATVEDTALDPAFHPAAQGLSYGPVSTMPNCVSAPPQGGPVDRATYTDQQLAAYGLPTWADWLARGNTDRAEWENVVRSSGTRVCFSRSMYSDGKILKAANLSGNSVIPVKAISHPARLAHPAPLIVPATPNISYCTVHFTIDVGIWWGWQSDSQNDCTMFPTHYQLQSMEGYFQVPKWDNLRSPQQNVAGWLGRGGWQTNNQCLAYDTNSLVQAGFLLTTYAYVTAINNAIWDNTGWAGGCGAHTISTSQDGTTPWTLNGGDLLQIIQGCGGTPSNNCTYTYIADTTQGTSNHYYSNYLPGLPPNMYSAGCMYEKMQSNSSYEAMWYNPMSIELCRVTRWDTFLGRAVETGVADYNAEKFVADDWNGDGGQCGYPDLPSNPYDPTWPNSTFVMERVGNGYC